MNSGWIIIIGVFLLITAILSSILIYLNRRVVKKYPKAMKDPIWRIAGGVLLGGLVLVKAFEIPNHISVYVLLAPVLLLFSFHSSRKVMYRIIYSSTVLLGCGLLYYLVTTNSISLGASVATMLVAFIIGFIVMFKYRYAE